MTGSSEDRLGRLFTGLYGLPGEGQKLLSDDQLRAALGAVDPHADDPVIAVQQRAPGVSLSVRQLGVVRLARQVLTDYFAQPLFHPDLGQQLLAASGALIAEAIPLDSWLLRRGHPLHGLIGLIEKVAAGWHPGLPQAAETAAVLAGWLRQPGLDLAAPTRWVEDMVQTNTK